MAKVINLEDMKRQRNKRERVEDIDVTQFHEFICNKLNGLHIQEMFFAQLNETIKALIKKTNIGENITLRPEQENLEDFANEFYENMEKQENVIEYDLILTGKADEKDITVFLKLGIPTVPKEALEGEILEGRVQIGVRTKIIWNVSEEVFRIYDWEAKDWGKEERYPQIRFKDKDDMKYAAIYYQLLSNDPDITEEDFRNFMKENKEVIELDKETPYTDVRLVLKQGIEKGATPSVRTTELILESADEDVNGMAVTFHAGYYEIRRYINQIMERKNPPYDTREIYFNEIAFKTGKKEAVAKYIKKMWDHYPQERSCCILPVTETLYISLGESDEHIKISKETLTKKEDTELSILMLKLENLFKAES